MNGRLRAKTPQAYRALVARFIAFYADSLARHPWGEQVAFRPGNVLTLSLLTQGLSEEAMRALFAPFVAWTADPANAIETVRPIAPWSTSGRSFWNVAGMRASGVDAMHYDERPDARPNQGWWSGDQDQVGMFLHGYDSLWLPTALLAPGKQARLVDALVEGAQAAPIAFHFNKGLAGAPDDALARSRDTATHPAVLDAFALVIVANGGMPLYPGVPWKAPDPALPRDDAAAVDRAMAPLYRIVPDGGSYVSESNYFNRRWSQAFWGDHYPRLLRVKRRYDPGGLFFAHHGVGSEAWSADGFQRLA